MTIQGIQVQGLLPGFWATVVSQDMKHQCPERGLKAEPRRTLEEVQQRSEGLSWEDFVCIFPLLRVRTVAVKGF